MDKDFPCCRFTNCKYTWHCPKHPTSDFLYDASFLPSPENLWTRHRLLAVEQGMAETEGRMVDTELPSLSARESNSGQTDGLNLHGRLSAFPISRMHTFNSARNGLGSRRGEGERLIINGADFGINQGRESRCASSRVSEKKREKEKKEREGEKSPSTTSN